MSLSDRGVELSRTFFLYVKAGNSGSEGDPSLPKVDGVAHPQAALPASGERNRPGFQD